jgi:hypothetical protein
MTDTPERVWMTHEDHGASWSGSYRTFRCSSLDHSNDGTPNPDYPEYIRLDLHEAAVAAARAEGMREAARIAEDYPEWCANWGEHRNQVAADAAAKEIASALRAEASK